ncbi:MAG: hypothetical protein J1E81_02315 [Eubacterium sp.]|nr:hypothetical protein [Eubacterium sp.]
MRVKITADNVFFKSLSVVYKNKEYSFKNDDCIFIDIDDSDRKIYVKNHSKSSITINFFDLIVGILAGDRTVTTVCCDYVFEIMSSDNCEISIVENKLNNKHNIYYESYCAVSKTAVLDNDRFIPNNINRLNKKSKKLSFFLMSGLPIYVLLAFLLIIIKPEQLIIPLIAVFLFFTIPCIIQHRRIKKYVREESISRKLLENVNGFRTDENYAEKLKTKSDKFIEKIVSKMVGE